MFTVEVLQYQIHLLQHAPRAASTKTVCAPVVSNTAPSVHGAISHGRPAEVRQEAEESFRGDSVSLDFYFRARQTIQRPGWNSDVLEIVTNYHEIALRSLEAWSTTAFLMDPDTEPAPILIKALSTYNTYSETRIESGPHPMGPPRRILAKALVQCLHSQLPSDGLFERI